MRVQVSCRALIAGVTALAVSAGTVLAQDTQRVPTGIRLTLDVLQGFRAGDNLSNSSAPTGDGLLSSTQLTFGLSTQTRTQSLGLRLGAEARAGHLPDEGGTVSEIASPFASLSYRRATSDAALNFNATLRENALRDDTLTVLDLDTLELVDLVIDNGSIRRGTADLRLQTGVGGPVETDFRLRYDQRRYDSANASLTDRDILRFNGSVRMAATRTADVVLDLNASREENDDAAQLAQDRVEVLAGVIVDLDRATRLDLRLGSSRIDVEENGLASSDTATVARAEWRRDLRNGTLSARFATEHSRSGTRQTLRFERALELPDAVLDISVGATQSSTSDLQPVVTLGYGREFRRGSLRVNISQTTRDNAEAEEYLNTRASLRYLHELSQLAELELNMSVTDIEQLSTIGGGDRRRNSLTLAVNYQISSDWVLSAGYQHEAQQTDGVTTLESNQIFANMRRSFDLRP